MADFSGLMGFEVEEETLDNEQIEFITIKGERFYLASQVARKLLNYSGISKPIIDKRVSKKNADKVLVRKYRSDINVINLMGIYELATNSNRGSNELMQELSERLGLSVQAPQELIYSYNGKELELKEFNFNGFEITAFEIDGEPYFLASEVTKVLGYRNTANTLSKHVRDRDKRTISKRYTTFGGYPFRTAINEPGLYDLIRGSHLPGAEQFKYWVSHEVLPSIRKTGSYSIKQTALTDENLRDQLLNPDTIIKIAQNWKEEQEKNKLLTEQNQMLEVEIKKTEPIVEYTNKVLESKELLATTLIASRFGIKGYTSAVKFNKLLQELGIQHRWGSTWYLNNKHEGNDYTFHQEFDKNGNPITPFMKWTQKGRLFLYEQLTKAGYAIRED